MTQQLLSVLPQVDTERFILGTLDIMVMERGEWLRRVPTDGTILLASNLQDRVLYRPVTSDSESNSMCWGAPDHQCHTLDHEACLYRVH
jgi:hypothetical protein